MADFATEEQVFNENDYFHGDVCIAESEPPTETENVESSDDDSDDNESNENDSSDRTLFRRALKSLNKPTPNYFDWRELFPQLQILIDNLDIIKEEYLGIKQWIPWPEDHFSDGGGSDWTVYPFLHTFPAYDTANASWIGSTCAQCPQTSEILRTLQPHIRTSLFSRLGPNTKISSHRGWADLSNYVLRCHLNIKIPSGASCGLIVDGEEKLHSQDEILVFDDSKYHRAYNNCVEERVVLIVDLLRPAHIPLGRAKGHHTQELDTFIAQFH